MNVKYLRLNSFNPPNSPPPTFPLHILGNTLELIITKDDFTIYIPLVTKCNLFELVSD